MATKTAAKKRFTAPAALRIVAETAVPNLVFDQPYTGRRSVYLEALQSLLDKPGSLIEIDSLAARSGISNQARKHGINVLFGEKGGKLYVKVLGSDSAEEAVLKVLAKGPLSFKDLAELVRRSHPTAPIAEVVDVLAQSGKIALRNDSRDIKNGQPVKKWFLAAAPASK